MANFVESYNITLGHEGGYVNDLDDAGGETFKGISRKFNPTWAGWRLIDVYKMHEGFPHNIIKYDYDLDEAVKTFYKRNYWDVNKLDDCPSQPVANEMFDTGVNMGTSRAGRYLQKALNLLNKNGTIYPDISVDGKVGSGTLSALKKCVEYRGDEYLYKILNIFQGYHYITYMTSSPVQEKYAYGWLKRVDFI